MTSAGTIFVSRKPAGKRSGDPEVRLLLKEYLAALHQDEGALILEELGLCQGNVRVDVAAVHGELSGFEIKSPADTLARWPRQQKIYSKVVDRAWLVAPIKSLERAETPDWWGQIAVFDDTDRLGLRVVRPAGINPKPDPKSIAKLLWRDEAIRALRDAGRARGVQTGNRRQVWARVVESFSLEDLRALVRAALLDRPARVEALRQAR